MRENLLLNLTGNVRIRETWNIFTSVNLYRVTRRDTEIGNISTRDLNVFLGVRKAFDIQQARLGVYDLTILSLSELENLYFLNGTNQTIEINDDMVYYMPLVESYKIKGRIIIDRDPNSTEGAISMEGIRASPYLGILF